MIFDYFEHVDFSVTVCDKDKVLFELHSKYEEEHNT